MTRLIVGIISAAGGLILGTAGGRSTSNITMKDVKAAPGRTLSFASNTVKKTGKKIGSGLSSLAFWKKDAKRVNKKANFEKKYQDLSEKHDKLEDDFSTAVVEKNTAEGQLADVREQLRQEKENNETFKNTLDQRDIDLKAAEDELKKLKKPTPKT
jgi:chromosome segregation ATPase